MDDLLHHVLQVSSSGIHEARRVKVVAHTRTSPIDGDRVGYHRLDKFLTDVARIRRILEGNGELVRFQEFELIGNSVAQVVANAAATFDRLVLGQDIQELQSLLSMAVGKDEIAEASLAVQNTHWIIVGGFNYAPA